MGNDYFNSSVQVLKSRCCPITMGGPKEVWRTLMLVSALAAACAPRQIPGAEIDSPSTPCTGQAIVPDWAHHLPDLAPYHPRIFVVATEKSVFIVTDYHGRLYSSVGRAYDENDRARLDYKGITAIVCHDKKGIFRLSTSFTHP